MPTRPSGSNHSASQDDHGPGDSDVRESGTAARRSGWQAGHLPRVPGAVSGEEPDWITGLLQDRLLDGLFQDGAGDQERPEAGTTGPRRSAEQWATGSPRQSRHSAESADLPDYEDECEDPPDRERL
jgi:hypothetical protein